MAKMNSPKKDLSKIGTGRKAILLEKQPPVVLLWSGGIDSTGVLAHLLKKGRDVVLISVDIYGSVFPQMSERESRARERLLSFITDLKLPGKIETHEEYSGDWIWKFSPDGKEIPRRNRYLIDYLICQHMIGEGWKELALGEYIGADTWLVRDHVGAADADTRALSSYIYLEWGLGYRLWTLDDFGHARYKSDRLRILIEGIGEKGASLTTNCMADTPDHCGVCYKCVERAAAWKFLGKKDPTKYTVDPSKHQRFPLYLRQMAGEDVQASMKELGW